MDFAIYYLKKAGSLLREESKGPLFTFLKFFKLLMILAIFLNAVFTIIIVETKNPLIDIDKSFCYDI